MEWLGLAVGWAAIEATASTIGVATVVGADMRLIGFGDGTMVVVGAVCSGASSVVGVVLAASGLACLLAGPITRKMLWIVTAVAVGLVANAVRLVGITVAGVTLGPELALGLVHAGAGIVTTSIAMLFMLTVARRFGLELPARSGTPILPRIAASSPQHVLSGAGVAAVSAVALVAWLATAPVLDRLAGPSAIDNVDAAEVVTQLHNDEHVVIETEPIPWVRQFYGDSEWRRFLVFSAAEGAEAGPAPVTVDVTTTRTPEAFDRLDLAACYGFHGRQAEHRIGVDRLGSRPAEEFAFVERGTSTLVVTWQTRVAGGVQRVAVSQLDGDRETVLAVAEAISEATSQGGEDPLVAASTPVDREGS